VGQVADTVDSAIFSTIVSAEYDSSPSQPAASTPLPDYTEHDAAAQQYRSPPLQGRSRSRSRVRCD